MQSQGTYCPICHEDYNQNQSIPRILPQCGHTVCSKCILSLLSKPQYSKCPFDNSPFPKDKNKIDDFKINFSLKDFIEEGTQWEMCPLHDERLRLICCTDKVKICDDCVHFGDHKGHDVRNIKQVQPDLVNKRKKLEAALESYDGHCKEVKLELEKTQDIFKRSVKTRFEELKWVLAQKEREFLYEIDNFFSVQNKKVNDVLKSKSKLREDLADALSKYRDVFKSNDIFSLIDEDISPIISGFDKELFGNCLKDFNENLRKLADNIEDSLTEKLSSLVDMEISFQKLHKASNNYFELYGYKPPVEEAVNPNIFNFTTQLEFTFHENLLEIKIAKKKPVNITIDLNQIKSIENVRFILDKKSLIYSENEDSKKKNEQRVLFFIIRKIDKITSMEFIGNFEALNDLSLQNLFPCVFWKANDVKTLKFDFYSSKVGGKTIEVFTEQILPKLKNLQSLDLNFGNTKISSSHAKKLFQSLSPILLTLEHFNLNVEKLPIKDESLTELFTPMPNMKSFCLNLIGAHFTDQGLNMLGPRSLSSMKNLESFALFVTGTKVTDTSISLLFDSMTKIKELALALNKTQITDTTLEALARNLPNMVNTLQDLVILLDGTKITDHGFIQMCMSMENTKELILHLDNTEVTDKSIEAFAKTTLPCMNKLERMGLGLSKTKISDEGALNLFNEMPDVKSLTLNLNSTDVTERFAERLVRKLADSMKGLKELDVGLVNTKISAVALNIVNEMKKDVLRRGNEVVPAQ